MLLTHIIRGNVIEFTATPADADGNVITCDSAMLHLSFMGASARETDDIEMTDNTDGTWSASWDSSVAYRGMVHWSVRTSEPSSADEAKFMLDANLANPDPGTE